MTHCDACSERIDSLPFNCRRCHGTFCHKHHLPEEHNCPGLNRGNIFIGLQSKRHHHHHVPIDFEPQTIPQHITHKNSKNYKKYIIGGLIVGIILFLALSFTGKLPFFEKTLNCSDGTIYHNCSLNKPYYCSEGNLTENPTLCGCQYGFALEGDKCIQLKRCVDKTFEGQCSKTKPLYCFHQTLVKDETRCGNITEEVIVQLEPKLTLFDKIILFLNGAKDKTTSTLADAKTDAVSLKDKSWSELVYNCSKDERYYDSACIPIVKCSDGTLSPECSDNKPYLCQDGTLVQRASVCGCPWRYEEDGDSCVEFDRAVEKKILSSTNTERNAAGLNDLQWDEGLAAVARAHSEDMATNNFFDHTNTRGEDPTDRAIRSGYNVHKELGGGWYSDGIAENIGMMPTGNVEGMGYVSNNPDSIAQAQVSSWMESPGHRANILGSEYLRLGVGVDYDGLNYISTQNFW